MNIFDKNLINYDNVVDLYYSWLYCRLHYLITKTVLQCYKPRTVLDIGCGTGFQSYLYSTAGCLVTGIDISENMIKSARSKMKDNGSLDETNLILFPERYDFVKSYNLLINSCIKYNRCMYNRPEFMLGNVEELPFKNNSFDHVSCCGSVLNLIDNCQLGLKEISRLVKPGGTIFVEVESRWTMDRFWTLLDFLLRNKIGFNTTFEDICTSIFCSPFKNICINYQYGERTSPIPIKLNLFTQYQLKKYFLTFNLKILKKWTIHSLTNLIPSVTLDTDYPSMNMVKVFGILSSIEERLPLQMPGCSKVFLLKRE